jgi:rod shape-determining protein MreD
LKRGETLGSRPPLRLMSAGEQRRFLLAQTRLALPALSTLALLLLMTAPLPIVLPLMPPLGVLAVFVWSMFQPGLMPPWVAFLLGLVADVLFGQPLGVDATALALVAMFVRGFEARYGHHAHGFDWAMAALMTAAHALLVWQLMALAGREVALAPMGWNCLTGLLAYPAVAMLCGWLQRRAFGLMRR